MKRKILLTTIILMATTMLAASLNIAFATTTYVDYEHAGAVCIINVPGHTPWIRLNVFGQMKGNYYQGCADRFMIYVRTGGTDAAPTFAPVAGYEDVPARSAFSASLGLPTVEHVVKPWQIGIFRIGKTAIVYWTVPLKVPVAPLSTSVVTLPPGMLILEGYDDKLAYSIGPVPIGTTGWNVQYSFHVYPANAKLFCPGWHCYNEPVGQGFTGLGFQTMVVVDRVWTWTHA
jgi:hypothetical protein